MRTWEDRAREEMYRRMALADDALRAYDEGKITRRAAFGLLRRAVNIRKAEERFWEADFDYAVFNAIALYVDRARQILKNK
jgi:hypothetical protein